MGLCVTFFQFNVPEGNARKTQIIRVLFYLPCSGCTFWNSLVVTSGVFVLKKFKLRDANGRVRLQRCQRWLCTVLTHDLMYIFSSSHMVWYGHYSLATSPQTHVLVARSLRVDFCLMVYRLILLQQVAFFLHDMIWYDYYSLATSPRIDVLVVRKLIFDFIFVSFEFFLAFLFFSLHNMIWSLFTSDQPSNTRMCYLRSKCRYFSPSLFFSTQVCDQPHPGVVLEILKSCIAGDCITACHRMKTLHDTGYSSNDIIGTVFRVSFSCVRVCVFYWKNSSCCVCVDDDGWWRGFVLVCENAKWLSRHSIFSVRFIWYGWVGLAYRRFFVFGCDCCGVQRYWGCFIFYFSLVSDFRRRKCRRGDY